MQNWFHYRRPVRRGLHRRPTRATVPSLAAVLALSGALALPASALAARFRITPHIANHTPIVNKKWPIRLTITSGRKKLRGSVKYQFMFQGSVVATRPRHGAFKFKNGVYRDQLVFTPDSVGQPLTLRIVVTVPGYGTRHLDWRISTQRSTTTTTTTP